MNIRSVAAATTVSIAQMRSSKRGGVGRYFEDPQVPKKRGFRVTRKRNINRSDRHTHKLSLHYTVTVFTSLRPS